VREEALGHRLIDDRDPLRPLGVVRGKESALHQRDAPSHEMFRADDVISELPTVSVRRLVACVGDAGPLALVESHEREGRGLYAWQRFHLSLYFAEQLRELHAFEAG